MLLLIVTSMFSGGGMVLAGDPAVQRTAVTKQQAEAFGREVARTLSAANPTFYNAHVDNDAIADTAVSGLSFIKDPHQQFAPFNANQPFMWQGKKCVFLGMRHTESEYVPILRVTRTAGMATNTSYLVRYLELHLALRADGSVRVIDIYDTDLGELATEADHRYAIQNLAVDPLQAADMQKLAGKDKDYAIHFRELQKLEEYAGCCDDESSGSQGDAIYSKLPSSLKGDKRIMRLHVYSTTGLGYAPFRKSLDGFRQMYPDPLGEATRIMSCFVILRRFPEARTEVDMLDRYLGGDPMLDVVRGFVSHQSGNADEEKKFYRSAVEREPTLIPGWFGLVALSLEQQQYDETVSLLDESGKRAGLPWNYVSTSGLFNAFRDTPQYAKWVKSHPQLPEPRPHSRDWDWPNWGN